LPVRAADVLVRVAADELLDVDAPITQRAALSIRLGDLRLDRDHALETRLEIVSHRAETYRDRAPRQLG